MKQKTNQFIPLIIVIVIILLTTSCSKSENSTSLVDKLEEPITVTNKAEVPITEELTFNDESAQITYDSNLWREIEISAGTSIQIKSEKKAVTIGAARFVSADDQIQYVENFKTFMQERSVDGVVEEDTLNGNPLLTYTENKGNFNITFSVLIVKDGDGYYEVTFACFSDLYEKYKLDASQVMETFQILKPNSEAVIIDNELAKSMNDIDKIAGYDEEAVKKNLSTDGVELLGTWEYENRNELSRSYNSDGTFSENLNEDNSSFIEGTWIYDSKTRIITHTVTRFILKGEDITNKMKRNILQVEVKNFDGNKMLTMSLESLDLNSFVKR